MFTVNSIGGEMENEKKKFNPFVIIIPILIVLLLAGAGGGYYYATKILPEKKYEEFMANGKKLVKDGEYDKAISEYEQAKLLMPDREDVYLAIANAYDEMGDELAEGIEDESEWKKIDKAIGKSVDCYENELAILKEGKKNASSSTKIKKEMDRVSDVLDEMDELYSMYDDLYNGHATIAKPEPEPVDPDPIDVEPATGEGAVLNIYAYNDELMTYMEEYYPDYEYVGYEEGKIGDVTVKWHIHYMYGTDADSFENALNTAIASDDPDERPDIIVFEPDYYTYLLDDEYTMPVSDLGITKKQLSSQFDYTKVIGTNDEGELKALAYYVSPGVLIYNNEAALNVLGTDDPEEVQEYVSTWDKYYETAALMEKNGYYMQGTSEDTYRVYAQNSDSAWVVDGKIIVGDQRKEWAEKTHELYLADGMTDSTQWSDGWFETFRSGEKQAFAFFGPSWLWYYTLAAEYDSIYNEEGFNVVPGPAEFYWGGMSLAGATGTDNEELVADILYQMTLNELVMGEMGEEEMIVPNSVYVIGCATPPTGTNVESTDTVYDYMYECAMNLDIPPVTKYDADLNSYFEMYMKEYILGNETYDEALEMFYENALYKYPELSY